MKPMIVNGKEVDQSVIDLCLARMKSGMHFRAFEIEAIAANAGVPSRDGSAMRCADRIIQQQRKAGNVAIRTGAQRCWHWIGQS
jgi:hypothetical protein